MRLLNHDEDQMTPAELLLLAFCGLLGCTYAGVLAAHDDWGGAVVLWVFSSALLVWSIAECIPTWVRRRRQEDDIARQRRLRKIDEEWRG